MDQMGISTHMNTKSPEFPVEVAVRHLCEQHRNLGRVLKALKSHTEAIAVAGSMPDFSLVAAVLHYVGTFSYGIHHFLEEEYLFSAMRRSGSANHAVDRAIAAHETGAKKFALMRTAFEAWRKTPDIRNSPLAELVADYVAFEFEHMSYEEYTLLPAAVDTLPAKDWETIAEAFHGSEDPLFGSNPAPALASLYFLLAVAPVSH